MNVIEFRKGLWSVWIALAFVLTWLDASGVDFTPVTVNVPSADIGTIERFAACMAGDSIPFIIDLWLPEGYDAISRYPVVYMADGQNLFDNYD